MRRLLSGGRRPAAHYSALSLLRHGLTGRDWPPAWTHHDLAPNYDVVIIGGGVHGLATAYYLAAKHGIRNVAVLEKSYIGGGASGRNTAIIRSNYLTSEGVRFYNRSLTLYQRLAAELNFNVMFEQRGHLTLAHNDASLRTMRWRAEVNKLEGVDSEVIGPAEIKELAPYLDLSEATRFPILGALYHPPAGLCGTTPLSGATPGARTRTASISIKGPPCSASKSRAVACAGSPPAAGRSPRRS